jgi:hypothetical protein
MAEYLKDKELEQQYQEIFKTTGTAGWDLIVTEVKELGQGISDIRTVQDMDDLRYRQGMLNVIDRVVGYRDVIKEQYDAQLKQEEEDAEDESV